MRFCISFLSYPNTGCDSPLVVCILEWLSLTALYCSSKQIDVTCKISCTFVWLRYCFACCHDMMLCDVSPLYCVQSLACVPINPHIFAVGIELQAAYTVANCKHPAFPESYQQILWCRIQWFCGIIWGSSPIEKYLER